MLYDVIVVGGGPGGYTAALYAARSGLTVAVLEKLSPGGQMATTSQIDNYPGFPDGVDGFDLGQQMARQAEKYGARTILAEVTGADLAASPKVLHTSEGDFQGRAVILATGAYPRELGLPDDVQLQLQGHAGHRRAAGPRATLTEHPDTIAGSATCLYDCMKHAVMQMGVPLASAVRAASLNPARSIGIEADYGSLEPGRWGNVILADDQLNIVKVIRKGEVLA